MWWPARRLKWEKQATSEMMDWRRTCVTCVTYCKSKIRWNFSFLFLKSQCNWTGQVYYSNTHPEMRLLLLSKAAFTPNATTTSFLLGVDARCSHQKRWTLVTSTSSFQFERQVSRLVARWCRAICRRKRSTLLRGKIGEQKVSLKKPRKA